MGLYLSDFESLQPPYRVPQGQALDWLAQAHARLGADRDRETLRKCFARFGCDETRIARRHSFLSDFAHNDFENMQIFGRNAGIAERQAFFNEALLPAVRRLYATKSPDFKNWIHVTCTGYHSPSVVQTLISEKEWGTRVQAMHAYHMGCYAAIPALRMARGNLDSEILHTELCSLHLDPRQHEAEQMVIQSLFADGVIRYRATERAPGHGYEVVDVEEFIAPNSTKQMQWTLSPSGFSMTLAREVPAMIREHVNSLLGPWRSADAVYAIHPGGPRVIDAVKDALGLSEEQVAISREILHDHGNMSSATLPHIWERMLPLIPKGTPVLSVAFGPGLTLAGCRLRKCV